MRTIPLEATMQQVKFSVPEKTWQDFRIICLRENVTIAERMAKMVTEYVAANKGRKE